MSKNLDYDMREQDAWIDDYEYGYSRRDPNLDPAFDSRDDVNGMFFLKNW